MPGTLTTAFNIDIQIGDNENTKKQDTVMPPVTVLRVDGVDTLTTMEEASVLAAQAYIDAKYNS